MSIRVYICLFVSLCQCLFAFVCAYVCLHGHFNQLDVRHDEHSKFNGYNRHHDLNKNRQYNKEDQRNHEDNKHNEHNKHKEHE